MTNEGIPLPELEKRWGVCRTTLRNRAKLLGVQFVRLSSTSSVWPHDSLEIAEKYHQHLRTGGNRLDFDLGEQEQEQEQETELERLRRENAALRAALRELL